ncbi:MAG: HAD superfamily hydrolase (TIGR01549 family) [Paraglaciecola sp.]|jgi:HAD superfamily hydrolase (TIGR01549 family)
MIYYRKLLPIQAITFDLDDTLYDNLPYIIAAEKALTAFLHDHYPDTQATDVAFWRQQKNKVLLANPEYKNDMGQLRRSTLQIGLSHLGYKGAELLKATEDSFRHFYHQRSNFLVDESICSLISELAKILPVVAITNGNVDVNRIGVGQFFQASYQASLAHPMKPDSAMFNAASKFLNIPAANILHVGDNLAKDVAGAIAAGYQTAWYAHDRPMNLNNERTGVLPHVQLESLEELKQLI